MTIDPTIIEAAARAIEAVFPDDIDREDAIKLATAVTPLIRAAALEEAAQVAENQPSAPLKIGAPQTWMKQQIAAAIRSLKEQPAESGAA